MKEFYKMITVENRLKQETINRQLRNNKRAVIALCTITVLTGCCWVAFLAVPFSLRIIKLTLDN